MAMHSWHISCSSIYIQTALNLNLEKIAMKHAYLLTFWLSVWMLILSVTTARFVAADTAPPVPHTSSHLEKTLHIKDALHWAYANNPKIASAKASWKQVIESYRVETGYPDPQLQTTYFPAPIETRLGPQDWNLNLSQPIPFPGKLSQKGKIVASRVRIARLRLDKTIKRVYTDIIISFQELYYIGKAIESAKKNFDLARELLKIGDTAYTQDQANFYDIAKARAQIARIQYDILLLEELVQTEKIAVNTLLNRPPDAPLGDVVELKHRKVAYTLPDILSLFLDAQEDMQIAGENVTLWDARVALSKFDRRPDFKLGLFYAGIGEPDVAAPPGDAGKDALGIQFGLTIPIWSSKNNGRIEQALAGKRNALSSKEQVANEGRTAISRAWFKLKNAERLIDLYQNSLIPQSLTSVQTAEIWYRQGEGSFSDFLEVQATAYNYTLSLERAKADYIQTFARLEFLVGTPLDRRRPDPGKGDAP